MQKNTFVDMDKVDTKQDVQKQVINEIETYIRRGGGEYEDWFVGITDNPLEPADDAMLLHKIHNEMLIYIETSSPQIARAVADYFINLCGTDGNIGANKTNRDLRSVYIYKKAAHLVC